MSFRSQIFLMLDFQHNLPAWIFIVLGADSANFAQWKPLLFDVVSRMDLQARLQWQARVAVWALKVRHSSQQLQRRVRPHRHDRSHSLLVSNHLACKVGPIEVQMSPPHLCNSSSTSSRYSYLSKFYLLPAELLSIEFRYLCEAYSGSWKSIIGEV